MQRRSFLHASAGAIGAAFLAACNNQAMTAGSEQTDDGRTWLMPDEGHPHARTWMAFAASEDIWGADLVPEVQRNLATIAGAIARAHPRPHLHRRHQSNLQRSRPRSPSNVAISLSTNPELPCTPMGRPDTKQAATHTKRPSKRSSGTATTPRLPSTQTEHRQGQTPRASTTTNPRIPAAATPTLPPRTATATESSTAMNAADSPAGKNPPAATSKPSTAANRDTSPASCAVDTTETRNPFETRLTSAS